MSASKVAEITQTINENPVINIGEDKSGSSSPQPVNKFSIKIKDLERILSKCKESLKQKNSQIKALKDALGELDDFKNCNQELRRELGELRESHESWTVSIAENKRLMHQELENKNNEIEVHKSEAKELQQRLNDSYNNVRQLKSAIHDLESRLVSTSAAHQKERDNLTKQLIQTKNDAIKQCQKENELQIERIKLDLERSIEALKVQLLSKDEHLVKTVTKQQELESRNHELEKQVEQLQDKLTALAAELETSQSKPQEEHQETEKFQQEIHELNARLDLLTTANEDQEREIQSLRREKDSLKGIRLEYEELLKKNESLARVIHENEGELQLQQDQLDQFSSMHQELDSIKKENHSLKANITQLKAELSDKNTDIATIKYQAESLSNRVDSLRAQLETANKLAEDLGIERDSIAKQNEKLIKQRRELDEQLVVRILSTMKDLETPNTSPLRDNSNSTQPNSNESSGKPLPDPLSLLEDLSSIALERSNNHMTATQRLQAVLLDSSVMSEELKRLREEISDLNKEKILENQCSLNETEQLRTENQALVHDQQAYEERIKHLESEIEIRETNLGESKTQLSSYTQKADNLEAELSNLKSAHDSQEKLIAKLNEELESLKSSSSTSDHTYQIKALQRVLQQYQEENQRLKETQKSLNDQLNRDPMDLPDSTQFEYLKNIVHQFMLGKEPLMLARVISAVFKFDKNQIDQICKVQETVQAALKTSH